MPFREKLKKAFKSSSPSSSKTNSPVIDQDGRWPSNVYRPGEPMPRPKYRAPVKKEHQDKLDSFNFKGSWRRRSHHSTYSPMGSRLPSRRGSLMGRPSFSGRKPSLSGRSRKSTSGPSTTTASNGAGVGQTTRESTDTRQTMDSHPEDDVAGGPLSFEGSRNNSVTSGSDKRFRDPHGAARPTALSTEVEQEGDDDVANVGLSRVNSHDKPSGPGAANPSSASPESRSRPRTAAKADSGQTSQDLNSLAKEGIAAHDHKPFTEEDLASALRRSHLAVPAQ